MRDPIMIGDIRDFHPQVTRKIDHHDVGDSKIYPYDVD